MTTQGILGMVISLIESIPGAWEGIQAMVVIVIALYLFNRFTRE